jgi:diadenosine tetraphosphatase ApaH/serine/threonine PP2A family protein phosphatase
VLGTYKYNLPIYDAIMASFDQLPIAAIINKTFFCVHGGLSPDVTTVSALRYPLRPAAPRCAPLRPAAPRCAALLCFLLPASCLLLPVCCLPLPAFCFARLLAV